METVSSYHSTCQIASFWNKLKIRFRGSILWNNIPFSVKHSEALTEFKNKLYKENIRTVLMPSVSIEMF